jgi:hypothetical protein
MTSEVRAWLLLLLLLLTGGASLGPPAAAGAAPALFDVNYVKDWGRLVDHGTEVNLILDQSSAGTYVLHACTRKRDDEACGQFGALELIRDDDMHCRDLIVQLVVVGSSLSPRTGQGSFT